MNNVVKTILITAALIGAFVSGKEAKAETRTENLYPRAFTVTGIDRAEDIVYLTDGAGELWSIYGADDWQNGDRAAAIINDNGTSDDISDDIITEIRYAG